MGPQLTADFFDKHISVLRLIPTEWEVDTDRRYYHLDLKMCQIKALSYGFSWGSESSLLPRLQSVTEVPSHILTLNLSLNDLVSLDQVGLHPFKNCHRLDASLNRIKSFLGVECLPHLRTLNLSHNCVKSVADLQTSHSLLELNLSMNALTDISDMPRLLSLSVLHLDNNRLQSLDGIQALPQLRELYAQRNLIPNITPISGCLHMTVLHVSDNQISSLSDTISVLTQLKRLKVISLLGNPIENDPDYTSTIREMTGVIRLDNIMIHETCKLQVSAPSPHTGAHTPSLCAGAHTTLQHVTSHAFDDQIRLARENMETKVSYLHMQILSLKDEFAAYEVEMRNKQAMSNRYLQSLTLADGHSPAVMDTPLPDNKIRLSPPTDRTSDYCAKSLTDLDPRDVRSTDEVLRAAYLKLSYEQSKNGDIS